MTAVYIMFTLRLATEKAFSHCLQFVTSLSDAQEASLFACWISRMSSIRNLDLQIRILKEQLR